MEDHAAVKGGEVKRLVIGLKAIGQGDLGDSGRVETLGQHRPRFPKEGEGFLVGGLPLNG